MHFYKKLNQTHPYLTTEDCLACVRQLAFTERKKKNLVTLFAFFFKIFVDIKIREMLFKY